MEVKKSTIVLPLRSTQRVGGGCAANTRQLRFRFPGSRRLIIRADSLPVTMSVLTAAQNANTAFSEIPIMSARPVYTWTILMHLRL